MQGTKVLLGLHGAGLTNMIFMPAGRDVEMQKGIPTTIVSSHRCMRLAIHTITSWRYRRRVQNTMKDYFLSDVFVDAARLSAVL
jgi:hypothetical protein